MNLRNDTGAVPRAWIASWWRYAAIGILIFTVLGLATGLDAKKPIKPEPPPVVMDGGLLYYSSFTFGVSPFTMYERDTASGTENIVSEIPGGSVGTVYAEPSELDHNGHWFVLAEHIGEYPPLNGAPYGIGQYAVYVQGLYDDPGSYFYENPQFEVQMEGGEPICYWVDSDTKIWVVARYRTADLTDVVPDSMGIYEFQVDWSSGRPEMIGDPAIVADSEDIPVKSNDTTGQWLDVHSFAISADHTMIYYSTSAGALVKLDLVSGEDMALAANFYRPRYHGGLDALVGRGLYGDGIYRVNADGTGLTTLVKKDYTQQDDPVWSPEGNQIAFEYTARKRNGRILFRQVRIVNAEDGSETVEVPPECDEVQTYGWVANP